MIAGPEPSTSAGDVARLLEPIRVGSKTDVRGGRELGRILRRWGPDVVHAQDRRAALAATTVAWVGAPVAATYHGVPDGAAGLWITAGPLAAAAPPLGRQRCWPPTLWWPGGWPSPLPLRRQWPAFYGGACACPPRSCG